MCSHGTHARATEHSPGRPSRNAGRIQGLHVTPDRMFQQVTTLHDTLAQAPHWMLAVAFIGRDFWRTAAVGSWPTEPAH